jgi:hypothetical protein
MSVGGLGTIVIWEYARAHNIPLPDSKTIISLLPVVSITPQDGYVDENTPVWQYGRSKGLDGEELRKKVDEHRKSGHAQIDSYLEQGLITPEKAAEGKKRWDQKHGYHS